jgi:hypothetical protein
MTAGVPLQLQLLHNTPEDRDSDDGVNHGSREGAIKGLLQEIGLGMERGVRKNSANM